MDLVGMMSIALLLVLLSTNSHAISSCNGPCQTLDDCQGQLICINGICSDDPNLGTQICGTGGGGQSVPTSDDGGCDSSGNLQCDGISYPTFTCSPQVTSSTQAILTNNDFSQGGDGGDPSQCDEQYQDNLERIVALLTGWFDDKSRCRKMIQIIYIKTGSSVIARVVDQCDSMNGCEASHAYRPPCQNDIVDGLDAV
ncbi:hypothetical protein BT93_F1311 [Corymbia citriodora subsp. variegata]|nr:hypothetical protein BT93_F1311 [Corymbia citriodora subsp. variegata]